MGPQQQLSTIVDKIWGYLRTTCPRILSKMELRKNSECEKYDLPSLMDTCDFCPSPHKMADLFVKFNSHSSDSLMHLTLFLLVKFTLEISCV